MLDILFASSKGSQYRYYKALSKSTAYNAKVVTHMPTFKLRLVRSGLSLRLIKESLHFHIERKKRKYESGKRPGWLIALYYAFSIVHFSIIYLSFVSYLDRKRPKVVCLWNGHRLPEMAIKAAAARYDIKVAHFENGLLPDTTTMDFSGVNAFASLPKEPNYYLDYAKSGQADRKEKSLEVRKPHKKRKNLVFEEFDFSCEYIFVPFQVNFDSQVIINSPRVNSMVELYDIVEKAVERIENKNIIFVVKEHPSDSRTYPELHDKNARIKFVNENTEDLIRNAQAVITLNSSVGIEAAMLGKVVFLLGDACYAIPGVTTAVNSPDMLVSAIDAAEDYAQNVELSNSFFSYLEKEYLLPGAWQKEQFGVDAHHLAVFEKKIQDQIG